MSFPAPQFSNREPRIQLALLLTLILAFGLMGNWVNPWLQYQRDAILQGQVWRLLTGHLVHLGVVHCLLNLLALLLILYLFSGVITLRHWWRLTIGLCLAISVLFLALNPKLSYYAGLSGVLHGLLAYALVISLSRPDIFNPIVVGFLLAAVAFKLVYEQSSHYDSGYLQHFMNAPVIVDAHAYGAAVGTSIGIGHRLWKKWHR